jgi:hypothetical protein
MPGLDYVPGQWRVSCDYFQRRRAGVSLVKTGNAALQAHLCIAGRQPLRKVVRGRREVSIFLRFQAPPLSLDRQRLALGTPAVIPSEGSWGLGSRLAG